MGSTESTLPAMEDTSGENRQHPQGTSQVSTTAIQRAVRQRRPRQRRHTYATANDAVGNGRNGSGNNGVDDPWWWEIENENLILDQVPNVTTVFSENASENLLSQDFNALLKISGNASATLAASNNFSNNIASSTARVLNASEGLYLSKNDYPVTVDTIANATADTTDMLTTVATVATAIESGVAHEQTLEEFKEELRVKRLARQTAVQDLRDEVATLRQQLATEQALTRRLRSNGNANDTTTDVIENASNSINDNDDCVDNAIATSIDNAIADNAIIDDEDDVDPKSRSRHANIELANAQLALQLANSENISLRSELGVVQKQVVTLKEVVACCKQMLAVKEEQCTQLKAKLTEIETSFGERELKIMSANLRQEYERQLGNMRQLRELYEERQRVAAAEHENLQRLISIKKDELLAEQEKTKNFEERNQTLLKEVEAANNELAALRDECNEHKFEKKALKEEMGAVNMLFSQMVMGFNGKNNVDIDRLTAMLEENRTLLNDMATNEANCSDGATLPKLLFELVEQASVSNRTSRSPTPLLLHEVLSDDDGDGEHANVKMQHAENYITDVDINTNTTQNNNSSSNNEEEAGINATEQNIESVVGSVNAVVAADAVLLHETDNVEVANCASAISCSLTDKDNVSDAGRNTKRHHRKTVGNKTKTLPANSSNNVTTIAAMKSTTTSNATLKFSEPDVIGKVASAQEIIGNLPKVWKVLMELLSHHKIEQVQFEENGASEDCYKSVETPNGPKAELSVSKTYIKLKDLILEKKSLVKETNRLKTLNSHLEYRLNEQEKRLSTVSLELTKTWHLVGKMQRQHRQLHTQEQILRYQLQQKRRLLSELKDELEYCRRKWAAARAKNDESQEQCNDLRREFAKRKLEDANHSAESGYSDSGPQSDEEAAAVDVAVGVGVGVGVGSNSGSGTGNCRRKHLKEMFEHTRKIKRMQSTSPGRATTAYGNEEIVLRWNSAPPTCGWRTGADDDDVEELMPKVLVMPMMTSASRGAIPKTAARTSRSTTRTSAAAADNTRVANADAEIEAEEGDGADTADIEVTDDNGNIEQPEERATRIQRLEEQCKSLIQQVLETSNNRERLEVQLCRFQDEIAPVQYAVPLTDFINKKRIERMTRASSAPATGSLTPREEEYTRKRSERLERLEEESRQLMSRIKRTSDRGHYLRCSLDRIRRAPNSREGSFESNTEEELSKTEDLSTTETSEKSEETSVEERQGTDISIAGEEANRVRQAARLQRREMRHNVAEETTESRAVKAIAEESLKAPAEAECSAEINEKSSLTSQEEAYTARRAARLQRLEEESRLLLTKLAQNTQRGDNLGNKLDTLHERYNANETATAEVSDIAEPKATVEERIENIEKISNNREERLRILEEEGKQLLSRLSNTSERGTQMINRIAEREQNRQARQACRDIPTCDDNLVDKALSTKDCGNAAEAIENPTVQNLMPTFKNVACSSIVCDELAECVKVTMTPSQIAAQQGAIPKSKPLAQLCASRSKATRTKEMNKERKTEESESLEEMVKRLRSMPYPEEKSTPVVTEEQNVEEKGEQTLSDEQKIKAAGKE